MSKNRRGGLGRGLGALIPTAPDESAGATDPTPESRAPDDAEDPQPVPTPLTDAESPVERAGDPDGAIGLVSVAGAHFVEVPVEQIRPNPRQPRQVFDEEALAELTYSIREFGVLQPIVVRGADDAETAYELVMGERRLRAATAAGLATVPAIVRTTGDEAMLRDALLENIHRAQLNPLEEAAAYQQLLQEFGTTHDELAARIGRSRPQVSNTIRLLNLPVPVQRRVAAGILSAGHARALLGVDDGEAQEDLAGRIVAEGLSVRATEELVALHQSGHTEKKSTRRPVSRRMTAPALTELAARLSDAFDTRVKIDLGQRKGKVTVEFATIDDLERIIDLMSGKLASNFPFGRQAESPAGPSAAGVGAVGTDYAGWGEDHVRDPGAWTPPTGSGDQEAEAGEPNDS